MDKLIGSLSQAAGILVSAWLLSMAPALFGTSSSGALASEIASSGPLQLADPAWTSPGNGAATDPSPLPSGIKVQRISQSTDEDEVAMPDGGIAVRLDESAGRDLFGPGEHVLTSLLTPGDSRRGEIDLSLSTPEDAPVPLTVTAGIFGTREPQLHGENTRHGVGRLGDWRENNVADLGLKLGLLGGKLRYAGGVTWSGYGSNPASHLRRDLDRRSGKAQWHEVHADLWSRAESSASVYGLYGTMDAAYRSLQQHSDAPLALDGRTRKLGGELQHGGKTLSLSYESVAGAEVALHEQRGKLDIGVLSLALAKGGLTIGGDEAPDGFWVRDRYWKGKAELETQRLLGTGGSLARLLPETLSFRVSRNRSSTAVAGPPQLRTKLGVGFGWSGDRSLTDITISRTVETQPASSAGRADAFALDVIQSFFGDNWDLTTTLSTSRRSAPDSGDRSYSGGVAFSLTDPNYPKLSIGLDINRSQFSLADVDYAARDHNISVSASADLSRYLPVVDTEHKPYLIVKAYGDWSFGSDTEAGDQSTLEPTILVAFGMRF